MRRPVAPGEAVDFVVAHGQPRFAPGEAGKWEYSNTGFVLLGMVIERIDGRALDKSFEERIFAPLGMDRTYLWNGIPRADFGLARSWLQAPFDYETTDWNMSQGWAAGGVISTPDDMHRFIEALVAGRLFASPGTLAALQQTVPTGGPTELGYGIGVKELAPGLWGHGGQTLGFLSSAGAFSAGGISYVGWGSSSMNIFALGDMAIVEALKTSGALPG
jgi:D-alanyl-D-alanine carboxypeptidase